MTATALRRALRATLLTCLAMALLTACGGAPAPDTAAQPDAATQDTAPAPPDADAPADAPPDADVATADAATTDAAMDAATVTDVTVTDVTVTDVTADAPTEDLGPSRGAPTVRITAPTAGATITGVGALTWQYAAPDGFREVVVLRDGREVGRLAWDMPALRVSTADAEPGPHTLAVQVVDARGRTATAAVDVVFRTPGFAIERVTPARPAWRNGDEVALDVATRGAGFALTADFSALDARYDPARVTVTDAGGGRYAVRYRLAADNTRADGTHAVVLRAVDRATPDLAVASPVPVRLANTPPIPFELSPGDLLPAGAPAFREAATGPRVTSAAVSAPLSAGGEARLDVAWTTTAPARALLVSAEGFAGTWLAALPAGGGARASLALRLPPGATLPTGEHRLRVRVVDADRVASASRDVTARVEALGRGGGGATMTVVGGAYFPKDLLAHPTTCALLGPSRTRVQVPLDAPARVRLVRDGDGAALDTTTVGAGGVFHLTAAVAAGASVHLELEPRAGAGATSDLEVRNRARIGYTHRGASFPARAGVVTQDLLVAPDLAGAFNVLDVLWAARVATLAAVVPAAGAPPLLAVWEPGAGTSCGDGAVSCYTPPGGGGGPGHTIQVTGLARDGDEWDDPVLRHEFGHFVHAVYSRSDSGGGPHSRRSRSAPPLAFAEGFATFWGALVADDVCYFDTRPFGGFSYRVDLPVGAPTDTAPSGDPAGDVSEGAVAAVLWHLARAPAVARPDAPPRDAVLHAMFGYVPAPARADRGATGTDLVDFLDGWVCASACREAEMRRYVVGTWDFAFPNPAGFGHCVAPFRDADLGAPTPRCAGPDALALQRTALARVALRDGAVAARPIGPAGASALPLSASTWDLAVVRATRGGPTRAVVTNVSEGTLSLLSIVAGEERELDTDDDPATRYPATAPAGVTRFDVGRGAGGTRGVAVTPDGRFALVAHAGARDELVTIDLDHLRECRRFRVGLPGGGASQPNDVVVHPDGRRAWVSLAGTDAAPGDAVAVVDVARATDCVDATDPVTGHVTLPDGRVGPRALALTSDGARLAVAGLATSRSYVIDTATGAVAIHAGTAGGSGPTAVAWTRDDGAVFFAHRAGIPGSIFAGNGTVWGTWPGRGALMGWLAIERPCQSLAVGRDDAWLYVGDSTARVTAIRIPAPGGAGRTTPLPPSLALPFANGAVVRLVAP